MSASLSAVRTDGASRFRAEGHDLSCPLCDGGWFRTRPAQLPTRSADPALLLLCQDCSHVLWFADASALESV